MTGVGDVPLLDRLEPPTRRALLDAGHRLEVGVGQIVTHDSGSEGSVYVVLDGLLKIVKRSRSDRVAFLALCRPGTLVGELAMLTESPRSSTVQAVEPSTVTEIRRERFEQLLDEHPDLGRQLLVLIADRIRVATAQIHDQTSADAATRIARRLIQLAEATAPEGDDEITLQLPISQEELGEWAGLSRAGVVKALRSLRSDGFIETSRMSITLRDLDGIRAASIV